MNDGLRPEIVLASACAPSPALLTTSRASISTALSPPATIATLPFAARPEVTGV